MLADENTYQSVRPIIKRPPMTALETEEKEFSDEELEQIIDMKAPKELIEGFESMVKESPLLMTGLAFAFGILIGAGLASRRRRSR
jgi:ElaB/YqjD/DUF883 family membrane-anchored ribosome-binding protein